MSWWRRLFGGTTQGGGSEACAQPAAGEARTVDLGGGVGLELVWIPPGEFLMGSPEGDEGRFDDEGPQHRVRIPRGFWMGRHEVTQGQWQAVMGSNPSHFREDAMPPVEWVSWAWSSVAPEPGRAGKGETKQRNCILLQAQSTCTYREVAPAGSEVLPVRYNPAGGAWN